MFTSLVRQATNNIVRRSVVAARPNAAEALFTTQMRSYAEAKKEGGEQKKKKAKKGKKRKKETKDGFSHIPNRFIRTLPADPFTPVAVPKISMSLMRGSQYVLKNQRLDKIECETVEEGQVVILPSMRNTMVRLQPGLVKFYKNEDEVEKYYITGGWMFVYYHGPVQLNCTEVYALSDLDVNLVRVEIERCKELNKSRDDKVRIQAQMAIEFLEPLQKVLEENEHA